MQIMGSTEWGEQEKSYIRLTDMRDPQKGLKLSKKGPLASVIYVGFGSHHK